MPGSEDAGELLLAPDRQQLNGLKRTVLKRARSLAQPDTYMVTWQGQPLVVKDMSTRAWLVRETWGRYVIAREVRALAALEQLEVAPRLAGRIDAYALAMQYICGKQLPRLTKDGVNEEFFAGLRNKVEVMHTHGVAHGDLRRTNILMDESGQPVLVDFASATVRPSPWRVISHTIFRLQQLMDRLNFEKLRRTILEGATDPIGHYPWVLRAAHSLRKALYRPIKRRRERRRGAPDRA